MFVLTVTISRDSAKHATVMVYVGAPDATEYPTENGSDAPTLRWPPSYTVIGDLTEPDTLVFTTEDFARYPKEELLEVTLRASLARSAFLFVGYSANDSDIIRELQWVTEAVREGPRVFSAYELGDGTRIWIITEADRSATTILLPVEY